MTQAQDGHGRVSIEGGLDLAIELPPGIAAGAAVDVAVRPENIRLHPDGVPVPALPGKIVELTFLGNTNEYMVVSGAQRVRVQTHPTQVFNVDDPVRIEFDPAQCTIFASR